MSDFEDQLRWAIHNCNERFARSLRWQAEHERGMTEEEWMTMLDRIMEEAPEHVQRWWITPQLGDAVIIAIINQEEPESTTQPKTPLQPQKARWN